LFSSKGVETARLESCFDLGPPLPVVQSEWVNRSGKIFPKVTVLMRKRK
jgi:hypothetical protein